MDSPGPQGQKSVVSPPAMMDIHDVQSPRPAPRQHEPTAGMPLRHRLCKSVRVVLSLKSDFIGTSGRGSRGAFGSVFVAAVRSPEPMRVLGKLPARMASSAILPRERPMASSKSIFTSPDLRIQTDADRGDSDINANGDHNGITSNSANIGTQPSLFHKIKGQKSILAIAVSDSRIYAGTQGGDLLVWSLETYELLASIAAHRGSILCLFLSPDGKVLLSSGGDAIVNIWCPSTLKQFFSIYSKYDVGDVFCVVYSEELQTVYLGAQNTSIQWYDLSRRDSRPRPHLNSHPSLRNDRFFDSKGPGGVITPRPSTGSLYAHGGQNLEIDENDVVQYAHYGYVYCMLLVTSLGSDDSDDEVLISGGGDGVIKIWTLDPESGGSIGHPLLLENGDESVLTMVLDGALLYSGRLDGEVNVWDIETRQLVRRVKAHSADTLTLAFGHGLFFAGGANGIAKIFNPRYECVAKWKAHDQLILASAIANYNGRAIFVTGGNDSCIAIWEVSDSVKVPQKVSLSSNGLPFRPTVAAPDTDCYLSEQLLVSLSRLVSFRTVSSKPEYAEDCRRGASWLRNLFKRFGATTEMFSTKENRNPIVYARFTGKSMQAKRGKRILFYGHYDVVAAENQKDTWNSDPFDMHGVNGYLYGRGVSDNKGPVLAALYAIVDLVAEQQLSSDVVFLIEGEEECGSRGFQEAVQRNKQTIGDIDWILLANSYWLNDEIPCLTYGLRGVVQATVKVESEHPDLHSGIDGSHLVDEPLKDLVALLASLRKPDRTVNIHGFYDPILPMTESENDRYDTISRTLLQSNPNLGDAGELVASFKARWREPSLTIHGIDTSGPVNPTIISHVATAILSIRLVPNQDTNTIQGALQSVLRNAFENLHTSNKLSIKIDRQADPWLGDPNNKIFQILEEAIMEVWSPIGHVRRASVPAIGAPSKKLTNGSPSPKSPVTSSTLSYGSDKFSQATAELQTSSKSKQTPFAGQSLQKPLYIREGGSIPAIRFLEKSFGAPAAHLPCGQASDSAHLDNERLRLSNLYKSREIFKKVFRELPWR